MVKKTAFENELLAATLTLLQEGKVLSMEELEKLQKDLVSGVLLQSLIDLLIAKGIFSEEELQSAYMELTGKLAGEVILEKIKVPSGTIH